MFCGLVSGITKVVAVRTEQNTPSEEQICSFLPEELCKMRASALSSVVQFQRPRLLDMGWTEMNIESVESDHRALLRAYRDEPAFKDVFDSLSNETSDYDRLWGECADRFPNLEAFCGGSASIFPNTSTVESDFSIINWEKDEFRDALGDFSLEGVMQTKQHAKVSELAE
eukprot:Plantae.Rhodophyta-Palmaria_palmata.ctg17575.p1 GENE.Plantae.Rhodophyta-Palmaria_palmata.ctg17575~~Plantae.Rhodophyta-Palmaria_palmata.ctg17575.p1  ORF type:complete len:193 (+),score=37.14 Plantae.Rhodophyta-Palmaria_palmata.ctg17575:71-580(+)